MKNIMNALKDMGNIFVYTGKERYEKESEMRYNKLYKAARRNAHA
ncbi:MAG: hypothetical protein PUF13_05240 [Lachnospiraceae bacterium]|nr:hypothetical protein [Lachnospiraceae bacterium]